MVQIQIKFIIGIIPNIQETNRKKEKKKKNQNKKNKQTNNVQPKKLKSRIW
jgi:hypothetical protein